MSGIIPNTTCDDPVESGSTPRCPAVIRTDPGKGTLRRGVRLWRTRVSKKIRGAGATSPRIYPVRRPGYLPTRGKCFPRRA